MTLKLVLSTIGTPVILKNAEINLPNPHFRYGYTGRSIDSPSMTP